MAHLMLEVTERCAAEFEAMVHANPTYLSTAEKAALLRTCVALETRVAELRMRVMIDADDVAAEHGARDVAQWLASAAHVQRSTAARDLLLARDLEEHVHLADAVRSGHVTLDQARVIVTALQRLPDDVGDDLLGEAERHLVAQATHFGPRELRALGEKVLEVIAPDAHERLEALRLQGQEDRARQQQRLTLRARGDGLTQISGALPDHVAIRLATYLHAFTNPRRPGADLFGQAEGLAQMPYPQRAAEAFGHLLESCDPQRLPLHGGDATTVLVTMTLDQLRTDLATAGLLDAPDDESEDRISAGEARRLACTASIIPVVLGNDSAVLDVGRGRRLFDRHQRKALAQRDTTCRTEGCTIPGTWSEAHHWIPWARGGATDLANAVLLCRHHHHLAHHPDWSVERLTNGDVRFQMRT